MSVDTLRAPRLGLRGRSRPLRGGRRALALVPVAAFVAYCVLAYAGWHEPVSVLVLFASFALLILGYLSAGVFWRSFTHLPPAHGRVLAVVPVYNEDEELVRATVRALLAQTILPDQIVVVDDGSRVPVVGFDDPLVRWERMPNGGKREAQAHALRLYAPSEFDFVLTVDSDSVLDDDALERLLEAMSDERVQAATGMILMRNWQENLLTRLTDINVVSSCLMFRMLRSWFGIVSPTSGCLALYRAPVLYDNLPDYLTSGTAGDDRRLSFYALLRGQVVGVSEAVVSTQLPATARGMFRQRTRWSKSAWLGIPFVATNLRLAVVFFYLLPLVFAALWPVMVAVLVTLTLRYDNPVLLHGVAFWLACSVTQTAVYAIYRPGLTFRQRVGQWGLALVYPLLGYLVLRPATYWALTKLRDSSWYTRS
ncbi:glycosyltransferase family 2 protein [Cryptosporangium phraense]|uniref:Hyaluronan synthase n=1 Tax=Cryptosporangium phraense TaxID=2593070 RepID=A0A545AUN1_9ACTN|nr:glycosyltransferase [Cryptosporangium phraense]TQS45048.1 glycosyltransferase [Cryptosporangium phraense]